MSDKLPRETQNDEVDLGLLFNAISRLFENLFTFIGKVFKALFSTSIYALKPFVKNIKVLLIIVMVAVVVGSIIEKTNKTVYVSNMLVKPYFNSKYQLANNVDYFNALISSENVFELSKIFEIDTSEAKQLISFEIEIGPETPNDLLVEYDGYLKQIDSNLTVDVSYESYIDNRDILSGNIFSISAESYQRDIFTSLERGFEKTFKNEYSEKLKNFRDQSIKIKQETYKKELSRIDSLQRIYLEVLKEESEDGNLKLGVEGLMPLIKERTITREYDLFKEEFKIRDSLRSLQERLIVESDYYDTLSDFEDVGTVKRDFWSKYSILFPTIAIIMMALGFFLLKVFKFIRDYE